MVLGVRMMNDLRFEMWNEFREDKSIVVYYHYVSEQ